MPNRYCSAECAEMLDRLQGSNIEAGKGGPGPIAFSRGKSGGKPAFLTQRLPGGSDESTLKPSSKD